jgi:cation transport ATPase
MGSGMGVAVETDRIALIGSNSRDIVTIIEFSKAAAARKIKQNLFWTLYNMKYAPRSLDCEIVKEKDLKLY